MRYITAPWRADYVRKALTMTTCIFCDALKGGDDRGAAVLYRGRRNFIMLNRFPYTPGHVMIAPCRHLGDFEKARPEEAAELAELLQLSLRVLRAAYRPQGFNAGMNLGHSAGAGVAVHYHCHVIPRWNGDSNFMPLVGGARVFIEDLDTTYGRLRPLFDKKTKRTKRAER
jgi:ATP adenylyltransferase